MPPRTVELWFDFASNYCYPTLMRIEPMAREHGLAIDWRPFLLGPVFQAMGWAGPPLFLHEAKGRYVWRDMERRCARFGLPFARPSAFPRHTVLALRIATLAADAPWMAAYCRAVAQASFAHDRDIGREEVLRDILAGLGQDADAVVAAATTQPVKDALRARTDEAMARGVFGAPTLFVDDEMFWGDDRVEDALEWAAGAGDAGHG
jgi:2-hydroxychromene-2-carboxylate isomerase